MIANRIDSTLLKKRAQTREKDSDDPRGHYFRDATAIMHCTAFRRLKHKTQVFFAPSNDHICTRLEHVLHVSSIAVTICKALELDTDMAWSIGLGHDLGHTPFGHLGEVILRDLTQKDFCHELHSLRVIDKLANLNLTYAVRDGIVTHCGEKFEQTISPTHEVKQIECYTDRSNYPATYEGTIVRIADKIAYLGRDFEDAVTMGLLDQDDMPLPIKHLLGSESNTDIINSFTRDVIKNAQSKQEIGFSDDIHEALLHLKEFNYQKIYKTPELIEQGNKFRTLLEIVYQYLFEAIELYKDDIQAYQSSKFEIVHRFGRHVNNFMHLYELQSEDSRKDAIIDYLAGMTDDYVISTVKNHLFPNFDMRK